MCVRIPCGYKPPKKKANPEKKSRGLKKNPREDEPKPISDVEFLAVKRTAIGRETGGLNRKGRI